MVACPPPSPRALPAAELAAAAAASASPPRSSASVPEAVARALKVAEPVEMVLITGSLYVVGTARAALRGAPTVQ